MRKEAVAQPSVAQCGRQALSIKGTVDRFPADLAPSTSLHYLGSGDRKLMCVI